MIIDARTELAEARATARMLHATGLGVPLIAVVTEAGLVAVNADWGLDDLILASAGPAEAEARLRLAIGRLSNAPRPAVGSSGPASWRSTPTPTRPSSRAARST